MRMRLFWGILLTVSLVSCGPRNNHHGKQQTIHYSDRSVDPGVVPTNPASYALMEDPNKRRAAFVDILVSLGNHCRIATEAVLKGGANGNDLWSVNCVDSGQWLVTFAPDTSKTAVSCRKSPEECEAAWKSVGVQP
jgi:hypothetical protein